jgi:Arc/MetJ-type ribon-helix-helix transcriptional regulator
MEDEQLGRHQQSEVQRQQLRELLAKQTKQRQSKKKQEETRQQQHQKDPIASGSGSQLPLRHWPEDSNVLLTPTSE